MMTLFCGFKLCQLIHVGKYHNLIQANMVETTNFSCRLEFRINMLLEVGDLYLVWWFNQPHPKKLSSSNWIIIIPKVWDENSKKMYLSCHPKMDGENNGKPYFLMYILGVPLPAIVPWMDCRHGVTDIQPRQASVMPRKRL